MTETSNIAPILITFGALFLFGLLADLAGRHTPLPRVTLLLLTGFIVGPSVLDWLPAFTEQWFPVLTDIALAMIGFLLGHNMTRSKLKKLGRPVLFISIGEVVVTALLVFIVLILFGVSAEIALLLAGIAPATDPAATVDVVHEYGAKGKFTDTLLGIVAIDDAWGLLVFSLLLAIAQMLGDQALGSQGALNTILMGGREIFGAVLLGLVIGLPMAFLTGRIQPGEPSQAEALGVVLLCAGLAEWMGFSYILSTMTAGAVVANLAKHHTRPFHEIEGLKWPFLILFFMLAGAVLHLEALVQAGMLVAAYIMLRATGLILGAYLGGRLSGSEMRDSHMIGLALLPQAGVAIGMALLVAQRFPELRDIILPITLGSTVVFELIGPVITRWTLTQVGDIPQNHKHEET